MFRKYLFNIKSICLVCDVRRTFSIKAMPKICGIDSNKNVHYNDRDGFVWKSGYKDWTDTNVTISEYIWKDLWKWQDKIALECAATGRKYKYYQLRDSVAAFAVRLRKHYKYRNGDIVGIMMPNIPEFSIGLLGAMEAGLTVTTLNPNYTSDEIYKQIKLSEPKMIISTAECQERIQMACKKANLSTKLVVIKTHRDDKLSNNAINFSELIDTFGVDFNSPECIQEQNPSDICLLPYSSGTTGLPKGVMLSHQNLVAGAANFNAPLPFERLSGETNAHNQDAWLGFLPFFHLSGLNATLIPKLAIGCKIITYPEFSAQSLLTGLLKYRPPVLFTVPPIFSLLVNHPNVRDEHLASIRSVVCGAAPLGESLVRKLHERKESIDFVHVYGLTETAAVTMSSQKMGTNLATVGWPSANTEAKIIKVDDPDCIGLNTYELGEILIRGPNVTSGYYKNPDATAATITSDGWLHTGDLGYYDENGYFYVADRIKELIKVNGYQVAPAELEDIIRAHPMVADVGVTGVADDRKGEVARAYVVVKNGTAAQQQQQQPAFSEKELIDFVASQVVEYKQLYGGVRFVDAIPKNATGKIMRRHLNQLDLNK